MTTILVVEDEPRVRRGLEVLLRGQGYEVIEASSGPEALLKAEAARPDLILLDVMLPGASGFEVLKTLRSRGQGVPVIMLTARASEMDRVSGFTLGVDDYVSKPFSMLELLGRVQAVLRRSAPAPTRPRAASEQAPLAFASIVVDFARHELCREGRPIALPERAIELLGMLAGVEGQLVSRDQLIDGVWGPQADVNPRTVDNLILKLRQAIEPDPSAPVHLVTVHGRGYRFLATPRPAAGG